jgi:predicted phage terminase large subunit-like protein
MGARRRLDRPRPAHASLLDWALEFLPHYCSEPPAPFHAELLADLRHSPRRLMARVAPRGHGKSTCAALIYPLWCVCERQARNVLILTHEASLATQFVRDLRHELESNERIQRRYGDLCRAAEDLPDATGPDSRPRRRAPSRRSAPPRRGKWSESAFVTTGGVAVQGRGAGASLRGVRVGPHRPDLIICDDLEKDALVESAQGRRRLEHWLRRVVLPALAPQGRVVLLGSILHYDSLLANLRDRQRWPGWDYRVYRALEARPGADGEYYLEPLWPARWPVERLEDERERIGSLAFEQEYQANPVDDSLRVFHPDWLRRYEPAELEARPGLINLMAVDPATGAQGGDYFAIWVGSLDAASGVLYTRQLTLARIGIVQQVQAIVEAFLDWRPVKIGIEIVAYQVALKEILEDHSRRHGLYMPVVALQTVANKRARIEGSAPFYENGTFRLPPALDPEVEAQFLHFPKSRHDDAPDVCAMGIELARTLRAGTHIDGATGGNGLFPQRGAW